MRRGIPRAFLRPTMILVAVAVMGTSTSCLGGSGSDAGSGSTIASSPVVSDPGPPLVSTRPAVVNRVMVEWPYDAAAGFGSIWISMAAGLTKLDPGSGRVLGTVTIPNSGEWSNVAVGGGAVWFGAGGTVVRVAPATGRVLSRINIGLADGTQAFEWIGANSHGFCTTQLVAKPGRAAICFDITLKTRFIAHAGPGPIAATTNGDIWVGGPRSPRSTSGRVRLTCLPLRVEARSRRWQRTELGSGSGGVGSREARRVVACRQSPGRLAHPD